MLLINIIIRRKFTYHFLSEFFNTYKFGKLYKVWVEIWFGGYLSRQKRPHLYTLYLHLYAPHIIGTTFQSNVWYCLAGSYSQIMVARNGGGGRHAAFYAKFDARRFFYPIPKKIWQKVITPPPPEYVSVIQASIQRRKSWTTTRTVRSSTSFSPF